MKVLMLGNVAFVGENLAKGLIDRGCTVIFYTDFRWSELFQKNYGDHSFDIVHIHMPNFKKLGVAYRYLKNSRLVCHWHGSDLRHPIKTFPVYRWLQKHSDMNLYSTLDLCWWLRYTDKKMLFNCPVDTKLFRPMDNVVKRGHTRFVGGGKSFDIHRISHRDMPVYLNQFETVDVVNADGLDDGLLSVITLEAVCCGCKVNQFPNLTRDWVIDNASINSQTDKLIDIYEELLK